MSRRDKREKLTVVGWPPSCTKQDADAADLSAEESSLECIFGTGHPYCYPTRFQVSYTLTSCRDIGILTAISEHRAPMSTSSHPSSSESRKVQ
jgi:hypothetical protein